MKRSNVALLITITAFAGCSDGEGPEPGTGEIPQLLLDVEGEAEDAYDKALDEDFVAVATAADKIDSAWRTVRSQLATDGAAAAELSAMDSAIAALVATTSTDAASVARTANAISAPMDELFAIYDPTVPADILALDYLGREVVLDARVVIAGAPAHIDEIQATWDRVKPAVVAAGGQQEAADYDRSIEAMRAAVSAQDEVALAAEANVGLELVDAIEGVFGQ